MKIISYILTVSFFIKYWFKFLTDFFCFFCLMAEKAIRSKGQQFGWFDIGQFFIYDLEICSMEFSLKSSERKIQHWEQMGHISHIRTGVIKIFRF